MSLNFEGQLMKCTRKEEWQDKDLACSLRGYFSKAIPYQEYHTRTQYLTSILMFFVGSMVAYFIEILCLAMNLLTTK